MKKNIATFFSLLFLISAQNLFAEINLISPVEGTWANRQVLLIDNTKNGDYFYSINGSDPETFGFAYDGPVLLDTNGEITLNVTFVSRDGKKESTSVNFTVIENEAKSTPSENFISSFFDSGIINYSAGSELCIPSDLYYSLGFSNYSFIPGQNISISEKSILTRNIPCILYDKSLNIKWRFIIKTFPQSAGIYSRRDVPFSISNWDTVTFTDENLLYKIDSEYWELPQKPRILDRSTSHMISWQNLEYNAGNPIEYFVLPPKPEICNEKMDDGSVIYSIQGDDSYTMSILSSDVLEYQELFSDFGVDTFYGDKVSGNLKIGIYCNSVYQGEIYSSYLVDKRPPSDPVISTNAKNFYSRENIIGTITSEKDTQLYVSISEPYELSDSSIEYDESSFAFMQLPESEFVLADNNTFNFELKSETEGVFYYKVRSYSKNGDNISQISEFQVILDQYNFYFDSESSVSNADGTILRPYNNFTECLEAINKTRSASLKVKGNLVISSGKNELNTNCVFENLGNGSIVFEGDSSLILKNAGVDISNFRIISKKGNSKTIVPNIKMENSVLTIKNSEAAIDFNKLGTFIDAYNSVINISDFIGSVSALSYSSFISAVTTRITIRNSTINTNADTTVIISSNDGIVNMSNNSFKVVGNVGRIAELFATSANLQYNTFNLQLSKKKDTSVIFADKNSEIIEKENTSYGL